MKQGQNVLDLGCGTGVLLPFIVQAVGATGSVVGVDVSDNMIDIATGKFAHLANVRTVRADIMEYEAERCVDHVTCLNFFPHVQEKEAF